MSHLVSVIIPTWNRATLLVRALASVAEQDHRPIEAVVVDDGSTDNTPVVMEQQRAVLASRGVELVTHRQANGGAPKARNTGLRLARGGLIAFLDSDDLWRPAYVSTTARLLHRYPSAGLAFCGITVIGPDDSVIKQRESRLPPEPAEGLLARPFDRIVRYMPLQTSGVMLRRSVAAEMGEFDLQLPVGEDWDWWYRIARRHDFAYTLQPLACNREHPHNLPKSSSTALASNLRLNLRHLPEASEPSTRQVLAERIRWQILMLQEQLMREGRPAGECEAFLNHELRPTSWRYRLGAVLRRAPSPVGRAYAGMIRWLGRRQRGQ